MKKFFKFVLYFFIFIFVVLTALMLILGKKYHYEKSIVINAPKEKVWTHIESMKAMNEWSPFLKIDPNAKVQYYGTTGQVGEGFTWDSDKKEAGKGDQKIIAIVPGEKLSTAIKFILPNPGDATSNVVLTPEGNQTKVTWDMDTEMPYPMNIMKLFMDGFMDESYGKGLNELKSISEK